MNTALENELSECERTIRGLLEQRRDDVELVSQFMGGDLLPAYREVSAQAEEKLQSMQTELQRLHDDILVFEQLRELGM